MKESNDGTATREVLQVRATFYDFPRKHPFGAIEPPSLVVLKFRC